MDSASKSSFTPISAAASRGRKGRNRTAKRRDKNAVQGTSTGTGMGTDEVLYCPRCVAPMIVCRRPDAPLCLVRATRRRMRAQGWVPMAEDYVSVYIRGLMKEAGRDDLVAFAPAWCDARTRKLRLSHYGYYMPARIYRYAQLLLVQAETAGGIGALDDPGLVDAVREFVAAPEEEQEARLALLALAAGDAEARLRANL